MRAASLVCIVVCAGCDRDCQFLDLIDLRAVPRTNGGPDVPVDTLIELGTGGLATRSDNRDTQVFEPLLQGLITATSTTPGQVRWTLLLGRLQDRVLFVEHPLPLEQGQVLSVESPVEDIDYTGDDGTSTWWDTDWNWTATATAGAVTRATLTDAFDFIESELGPTPTGTAISGTIEVLDAEPVELRIGIIALDGPPPEAGQPDTRTTVAVWADLFFSTRIEARACR